MPKKVFVVGPGYVGREIIDLLLADGGYEVTTLVRREEAAKELEKDGRVIGIPSTRKARLLICLQACKPRSEI